MKPGGGRYTGEMMRAGLGVLLVLVSPLTTEAQFWRCLQPDGTPLYQDSPAADCLKLQDQGLGSTQTVPAPAHSDSPPVTAPGAGRRQESPPADAPLHRQPFSTATRRLPILVFYDLPEAMREQGWRSLNHGDALHGEVTVEYLPSGEGPAVTSDHHFRPGFQVALRRATYAAAQAVHYDARYLRVHLALLAHRLLGAGVSIDGPSAGVAWAVAITSALLGDPIRSDVCLSGTVEASLEVGWVGALEDKIEGCRRFGYRELIIPEGQHSFDLDLKRQAYNIRITTVRSLDEAYESATGRSVRQVR